MGVYIFLGIMLTLLVPSLLISLVADLTWWKITLLVAVVLLVGGYFFVSDSETFQTLYWRWAVPAVPRDETAFIGVADELRALRAEAASSTDQQVALRQTDARLCALPTDVDNWVGRVEQRYSLSTGEGASLTIGIWPRLVVRTALFADNTGTLIRAGTPLFATVSDLRTGDVVRFSGHIVGHDGACPDDPAIAPNEKLRDPEFLLRFEKVTKEAAH
jgi:hypothetical protein